MILAKMAPVTVARMAKRRPRAALTEARMSSIGLRRCRYITEVTHDTRKARVATHAVGKLIE